MRTPDLTGRVILDAVIGGQSQRIEFPRGGDAAVFADHTDRYPEYVGFGSFRGPLAGLLAHAEGWESVTVKCVGGDTLTFEWEREELPPKGRGRKSTKCSESPEVLLAACRKLVAEVKRHQCEWNGFAVRDAIQRLEQLCKTTL